MANTMQREGRRGAMGEGAHCMTLLEILMATFILALGLVGVMSVVPVAIHHARGAIHTSRGASVAQSAKVNLKNFRLHHDDNGDTDFSGHEGTWGALPDFLIDEGLIDNPDTYIVQHPDQEGNDVLYVLDDPDPDAQRPYAWRVEEEDIVIFGDRDQYRRVTLTVFFPPPYGSDRVAYSKTFTMRRH